MVDKQTETQTDTEDPVKALAYKLICEFAETPADIVIMMGCNEFFPLDPNSFGFEHLGGVAFKYDESLTKNGSNLCRIFALPDGTRRMVWYKIQYHTIGNEKFIDTISELEAADKIQPDGMEEEWWKRTNCCVRIPEILRVFEKPRFKLGRTVCTINAYNTFSEEEMNRCMSRHHRGDWGDLCEADRKRNNAALNAKNPCRLMSVYKLDEKRTMWIITEWNRSKTTILLPDDY